MANLPVNLERAQALEQGLLDIGRASKASGVSVRMIRHYEATGLLPRAARTQANYRLYGPSEVHMIRFIKRARALGFSMADIRELAGLWQDKSRSSAAVKRVAGRHLSELGRRIGELEAMQGALEHLVRHCHGDHRPDCPILEDLGQD